MQVPHNIALVSNAPQPQQWSHKIVMELEKKSLSPNDFVVMVTL